MALVMGPARLSILVLLIYTTHAARPHYTTALAEGCQHPVMEDGPGQHVPGCGDLEMTTGTEIDTYTELDGWSGPSWDTLPSWIKSPARRGRGSIYKTRDRPSLQQMEM
ncbi:hypothetical protein F5Y14DRAFT_399009 [Nemania sp. NC0429]|nr:hypothetical protein F5Y14DRAFT_399009 [Nemania sp. NC0429]